MSDDERNDLVVDNLDLVDRVVRYSRDVHFTDDLRQEAYIGLLDAARRYDASRGSFRVYAVQRIRGAVRDFMRTMVGRKNRFKMRRATVITQTDAGRDWDFAIDGMVCKRPTPDTIVQSNDTIRHMLSPLSQRCQMVLLHYHLGGRLQREIADDLDITASRVSQLLISARDALRGKWGDGLHCVYETE